MAIIAKIGADTSEFNVKLSEAKIHAEKFGDELHKLVAEFIGFEAAKKAAEAIHEFVIGGIEAIDANAKLARQLGTTNDGLRAAQIAASEAGIANETLATALQRLNVNLGQAQAGSAAAQKGFVALGLSAANLSAMNADQRLATIADRVRELGLSTSQTAAILKDFGIKGGELVDILRQGGESFREGAEAVNKFGLSLSEVESMQIEKAADAMGRVKLVLEGVRNQVVVALAPYIEALSKKFTALATAQGGWGKAAVEATESVINSLAYMADVLRGIEVVWQGIKVTVLAVVAVIVSQFEIMFSTVTAVLDTVVEEINAVIAVLNAMGATIAKLPSPGDSNFAQGVHELGDNIRNTVVEAEADLKSLALTPMPSDGIKKFWQSIKDDSKAAATEAVKNLSSLHGSGAETADPTDSKKADAEYNAYMEHLRKRIEGLKDSVLTEKQTEDKAYQAKLDDLNAFGAASIISEAQTATLREQLQVKHIQKLSEINTKGLTAQQKFHEMTYAMQAQTVAGSIADSTASVANGSKAMFNIHKAAALAQAAVSLPAAIIESFKNAGGYPWGILAAGAMAAAGAVQIAAIASSHYGGGSSGAPSPSAGMSNAQPAAAAAPAPAAQRPGGLMVVEGINSDSFFSGRVVRELATKLSDFTRDGGAVEFA